jgi:glycerol-3-phosphate acyltransferase PlsY
MGATNILRTLGKGAAATVLLVDALKGAAAVLWAHWVVNQREWFLTLGIPDSPVATIQEDLLPWLGILAAFMAIVGHSKPIWLQFKGGKSVATSLGILLALSWPVALASFGVWMLGLGLSRIVSFSSILAAVAVPTLMLAFQQPLAYCLFGLAAGIYVIGTHRRNLERLLAGTEPRIGQKLPDHA